MATHNLHSAEFVIVPEKKIEYCTMDDLRCNGKLLMTIFDACIDAFAGRLSLTITTQNTILIYLLGYLLEAICIVLKTHFRFGSPNKSSIGDSLTCLYLRNLELAENDIPNIIATCKRLEYLRLSTCQTEDGVLHLQVEHPRLVELDISRAGLELVELSSLPNLKRLVFSFWFYPQEPLSFGNIPLLSSLSLANVSRGWQKVIRLSEFLASVPSIRDLHLNFLSEKIWVQPECLKLLSPVLQNLQFLNLENLPEGCDIAWTRFFLEATPNLKEVCITVWDHWCDMETDKVEREEQGYCEKTNVEWESPAPDGFRHYNVTKLTIYGFEPNDNFMGYMWHIMKAAVNLEEISLYDRKVLECCEELDTKIEVAPSRYPQTIEEQELLRKQITEGLVMAPPHVIHFRS